MAVELSGKEPTDAGEDRSTPAGGAESSRTEAILEAVAFAAARLLREPAWERAIGEVLTRLGEAARVDRVYIFDNRVGEDGGHQGSQLYEWAAPGVTPQIDSPLLQDASYSARGFARWEEAFLRNEAVYGVVEELPESERAVLREQSIVSIAAVPVYAGRRWWGYIGVDDCRSGRRWSGSELEALRVAAETVGAAIERRHTLDALHRTIAQLDALLVMNEAVAASDNSEQLLQEALTGLRAIGADRAAVLLFNEAGMMRFEASEGLSESYRRATEGHTPWSEDTEDPVPVLVPDIEFQPDLDRLRPTILAEGIRALAFIPLLNRGRLLGKFMLCYDSPHSFEDEEVRLAGSIAAQVATALARRTAETELRKAEARFRTLTEQIPAATYIERWDEDFTSTYISPQIEDLTGHSREEWMREQRAWLKFVHPEDRARIHGLQQRCFENEEEFSAEYRLLRPDGTIIWVRDQDAIQRDDSGKPITVQGIMLDVTDSKHAEQGLREAASLQQATLESTADAILVVNRNERIVSHNNKFAKLWGAPQEVMEARDDRVAITHFARQVVDPEAFRRTIEEVAANPESDSFDVIEFKDGRVLERYSHPQRLDGDVVGHVWSFRDVTEQRRAQAQLAHRAHHDELTDLPNRRLFQEHLELALARAARRKRAVAVLYIDLERFKLVNDGLGHGAGDTVLVQVAERLRTQMRAEDLAARHSGDEFLLILADLQARDARSAVEAAAARMHAALHRPFRVGDEEISLDASIGVSIYPQDATDGDELLSCADKAMYTSKRERLGGTRFSAKTDPDPTARPSLTGLLRRVLGCR